MKKISKLGMILSIIVLGVIIISSLLFSNNVYYDTAKIVSVSISFLFIIFWIVFYQQITPRLQKLEKHKKSLLIIGYFFILFIIQCLFARELMVNPSWDFGVVYNNALNFVNKIPINYLAYFEYCPNNIMIYLLYIFVIKILSIFSISKYLSGLVFLNILLIDLAIFLLYKVAQKIYDKKSAHTVLFIALFLSPLLLYTPIVYTDTLTMFFPLLYIYLYLRLKEKNGSKFLNYVLLGLSIFVGYKLKMSCLIMFVAIFIHMILNKEFKLLMKIGLVVGVTCLVCSCLFNVFIINNSKFHFKDNNVGELPFTHYIMMGLADPLKNDSSAYGGYNEDDVNFTKSFSKEIRKKENITEILKRFHNYTFFSLGNYYGRKIANTWGDGTYYAPIKISKMPLKKSPLHEIFLPDGKYFLIYSTIAQAIQFSLLFLMFLSTIIDRLKKDRSYLYLSIIGLFIFLLIWETRSRYLVNYIPIFLLTVIPAISKLSELLNHHKTIDNFSNSN